MAKNKTPASEPATGKDVTGMIPAKVLNSILNKDKATKKEQSALSGELGQKIAEAVDRFGTNRKALSTVRMLNRMEPEKLADYLDHLDYMLDISGIEARAAAVQRLPLGENAAPDAPADEHENDPDAKVSRPKFGAAKEKAPATADAG